MIDNYDSFTYNLVQYLRQLGEAVVVKRNDDTGVEAILAMKPDMIVLSPGPGTPRQAGCCLAVIEAFKGRIPILGICLGHQALAGAFGAEVTRAAEPVHGKVHAVRHTGKGVFEGLKDPLMATRYHSLAVDRATVPECFEITAWTEDGEIMGLLHRDHLIEGVQFHPEAILTEYGLDMLENFLRRAKSRRNSGSEYLW